ncbi:MFS transporter [Terrisporobacter mayombei]|uniref:Riboflavin transporter RibZ n=1 Tax=Terrisporobacter mayombei TaxID=1541 RepID=A0ABY9Q6K3_9FIRM|nr:MFS transporter [Terrisporobacter mayombei]MCC3868881.1 MFS transporter [Terrisporobacter mayombei]WMT82984.1 Riboflavin transporter RibZ [Terrisporobacter mayombei]
MKNDNYKWIALSCTSMGALVSVMSASTLMIALPDIMKSLNASMGTLTWILMGYMLVLTILVPSIGRVADMFGRKKLYVGGFTVFTIASLLCSFSNSGLQLLIYRLIQGVGASFMVANSTAIVTDAFPKNELGKALGINSMFISIGSVIGPILGGFLADIGWRYIFYINIPIGIIGTIWSAAQLKEINTYDKNERFDWLGTITFTISMLSLLIALTLGGFNGWSDKEVIALFIVSFISMIAFFNMENKIEAHLMDMGLFKNRILAFAYASNLFNGIARGAVTFLMVFYFQGIKGIDPMMSGILLTPFAVAMLIIAPISGMLSDKYDSRILSSLGLLISAVGLIGLIKINANTSITQLIIWMFIMGVGSGFFFSPNTNSIMGAVPVYKRGIASGVRTMVTNAGNVLSIAISMAILSTSISPKVMSGLFLGTQIGSKGIEVSGFVSGLSIVFTISFIFSIIAAIMSYMRGPALKWKENN